MRSFDFAPFYRSTVGFDRLFDMLDHVGGAEGAVPGYPPYNIERSAENTYSISIAVAGFTDSDLSIEVKENTLRSAARSRPLPARGKARRCSIEVSRDAILSEAFNSPTMFRFRARTWRTVFFA